MVLPGGRSVLLKTVRGPPASVESLLTIKAFSHAINFLNVNCPLPLPMLLNAVKKKAPAETIGTRRLAKQSNLIAYIVRQGSIIGQDDPNEGTVGNLRN